MMKKDAQFSWTYLAPYAGRWVAVVHGRVAGVGWTSEDARRAANRNRPKDEARVIFVPAVKVTQDVCDDS
ncbi:MAG: hypothetical protein GY832_24175 [Chloroflexi bacterium]|nr:hypothetical protein [Chloroflexota bacterium]